jgi:GTPase SAR1 family protein
MGSNQSKTSVRQLVPGLQFRVLVLGRANAGKTTILQRVCETTESPKIYRGGEEVRHSGSHFYSEV